MDEYPFKVISTKGMGHGVGHQLKLKMAIHQGYVPETCLLNGNIVWGLVEKGEDPCQDCNHPREKCHGRPKKDKKIKTKYSEDDPTKKGYIDRLCLVDLHHDSVTIFITDLVINEIVFSRTIRGELPTLIQKAIQTALNKLATRIVFDVEPGSGGMMLKAELQRHDLKRFFPYQAIRDPNHDHFRM